MPLQKLISQVKPNLGHSEGASGMSSVIKMVLALEHKTIPPNINFKKPNPQSMSLMEGYLVQKANKIYSSLGRSEIEGASHSYTLASRSS